MNMHTTPGMIHQALTAAEHLPSGHPQPKLSPDGSHGLLAEDLAVLGALVVKAGGVEQLARILSIWQDKPK